MTYVICIAIGFIAGLLIAALFSLSGHIDEVERLEAEIARLRKHLGEIPPRKEDEDEQ